MTAPFTTVPGDTPEVPPGTVTDRAGDITLSGNLVLSNGVLKLGTVAGAPLPLPGVVQLYTTDGASLASVGAGGQGVSQTVSGNLTVNGNENVGGTLAVSSAQATSGVVQITNTATNASDGTLHMEQTTAGSRAIGIRVAGDAQQMYVMTTDGTARYGAGGASVRDTTLGRAGAGVLYTDKNMLVGSATALGDNGVGELQLANATTVPTTNPAGGSLIYASGGGLFNRDPNGTVQPLLSGIQVAGGPTGVLCSTAHAFDASGTATPVSGTLYIQRVFLAMGQTVSNIGFVTGLTAATGPTHWWTALLDNGYKQQAHSADQLTGAIQASTWKTLAMVTPYTATYSGAHFLAVMIATSTTQPTLVSTTTVPNAALISGSGLIGPVPGGTSSTALTTPGTDNTTVYTTPTTASNFFYMYAS